LFDDKVILITGGTGSFGNAALEKFLDSNAKEIRILSRDEKKQDDIRKKYKNSKLKFYIGDVRDKLSINTAVNGAHLVLHAAALKQVPSCEFFPIQAIKTNVLGTENVLRASIEAEVDRVICLSTDKAVYPINAMGISKAMMEKVMVSVSRESNKTIICGTRYGNVMASRGSVIPLFLSQIENNRPITVTNPDMTRFMMTLQDAVDLVIFAFENGENGDIFIQKSPATTLRILARCVPEVLGYKNYPIATIGTRHGEKLHEVLLSREERGQSEDLGNYFKIRPDQRDLNYDIFVESGQHDIDLLEEYNSQNTVRLDEQQMKALLNQLDVVKNHQKKPLSTPGSQ